MDHHQGAVGYELFGRDDVAAPGPQLEFGHRDGTGRIDGLD